MSALCGWLGTSGDERPPADVLDTMADAFRGRRQRAARAAGPGAALWVDSAQPERGLAAAEPPWTAIVGWPRWRDPRLAEEQRTRGAASALRLAYLEHGVELFERLAGGFALAVLDPARSTALVAIDRMGLHALSYATSSAGELVFGSSADLVRAHPRVGASVPLQAVYNYLHAFVCRAPGSIYAEQRKLGPGQYLLWQDRTQTVRTYWRTRFVPDRTRTSGELEEELVEQVRRAVHRAHAEAEGRPVGAFLSGGLDSSTVAGMLNEATAGPAPTFTIGFDRQGYDEMAFAEAATRRFGTRAHHYYLTPEDTAELVPRIAAFYDEPFGNSSAVPAYYCAALARDNGVECLFAGDGGDEILAGNARYLELTRRGAYLALPAALRGVIKLAAHRAPLLARTALAARARDHIRRAEMPLPDRLEAYNFYQVERMAEVFAPDALEALDLQAPWREMRTVYEEQDSSDPLQRMMHLDLKQALADADLKKVTGMCDLAGIEVRFPLLDDDLVAFCATIPPELHLEGGRLRAFFKSAFRDFLPEEVLAKKKHGFGMPFAEWTREHPRLRELAGDSLGALRRRGLLRDDFLERVRAAQDDPGPSPYHGLVWDLMMLELWLESHDI